MPVSSLRHCAVSCDCKHSLTVGNHDPRDFRSFLGRSFRASQVDHVGCPSLPGRHPFIVDGGVVYCPAHTAHDDCRAVKGPSEDVDDFHHVIVIDVGQTCIAKSVCPRLAVSAVPMNFGRAARTQDGDDFGSVLQILDSEGRRYGVIIVYSYRLWNRHSAGIAWQVHYRSVRTAPEGTVTFLFSDVEGSTQLLERHGAPMGAALARHHEIFARAVSARDGVIFETVGDAVYAAFARPVDAASAAIAADQALAAEDWGPIERLAVRIALHTGAVERRGDHYFGPVLFRAARLQALGHGEQVLISGVTAHLLRDGLPDGSSLRDLGIHRLKDLGEPEHVFQLVHPDLRADFPALRSLDVHPHNLPVQLSSFVGREAELAELARLLNDERLVTLIGPGGIGKTRVALQAAADQIDRFADGVFFVDLAALRDRDLLPGAIAEALDISEEPGRPMRQSLEEHLSERTMLLLLDNLEQLLPAAGRTVAELLEGARALRVLATSRAPLRVRGEREYSISGLDAGTSDRLDPKPPPAVALFVERARAIGVDVEVNRETGPMLAAICARLDGLPLAIELAAARLRLFSLKQLHDSLTKLLSLGAGAADLPERQQTLRAAIAWTEELLSPAERRVFARLGVFVGGFTLDAAEAVAGVEPSIDAIEMVSTLLEQSLLRRIDSAEEEPRYGMLEMIREYAAERLEEAGEADAARARLTDYLINLVAELEPALVGAGQERAVKRLDAELANLRLSLAWLREQRDPRFARLAAPLARYWGMRGLLSEGRAWIGEARAAAPEGPPQDVARLLHADGLLASEQGALADSVHLLGEAASLYRAAGDGAALGRVLVTLSNAEQALGRLEAAAESASEAARLAHETADLRSEASATGNLALIALRQGRVDEAQEGISRVVEMLRRVGDVLGVAVGLGNLGAIATQTGDLDRAAALHREALATAASLNNPALEGWARANLAGALCRRGDWAAAAPLVVDGITQLMAAEDAVALVNAIGVAAAILAASGDMRTAITAWSAAEANAERLGFPLERDDGDQADIQRARDSVEPSQWDEWAAEGAALNYRDAAELVAGRLAG